MPGVRLHFGTAYTDARERLLYNTLRYQLEEIMRSYLFHTNHISPVYFIFDMSNVNFQSESLFS